MDGHKLFIALRLMNSGSAADVMRYGWAGGMEEEVVKCVLKQALEGIKYVSPFRSTPPVAPILPPSIIRSLPNRFARDISD